jgi:glycosyltransferase involved in cell wall biosynthesis
MYPTEEHPYYGIFVKEQIDTIKLIEDIDYSVHYIKGYKSKWEYIKSIFSINYEIFKEKPDLIHVHYGLSGLFLLVNPWIKRKTFITLHGGDINSAQGNKIQITLTKKIIKSVCTVYVMNEYMKKVAEDFNNNCKILKCGVNIDFFSCRKKIKQQNKYLLVFPSNKEREVKNFSLFEKVFNEVKKEFTDIEYREIKDMTRTQVRDMFCQANCLLLTSISEGSPQVIKEAMACDLPIVSVDVGDVKEVLHNVENSYVAQTYNVNELKELVIKTLKATERQYNSRDTIKALNLDNTQIAKKIVLDYEKCIETL